VCLALAAAKASTATQSALFVMAVCSGIALALTTMIDRVGNRAQSKTRGEYVARYDEDPWNGRR
jgi:hypothetical protein